MPITSLRVTFPRGVAHPAQHHAPVISALLLSSSPITKNQQRTSQSSRSFWWSRQERTSYLDTGIQKHIQRQNRIFKHKYVRAIRRSAQWERSPRDNHDRLAGWRLASSWYKDPNRPGSEGKTENGKDCESKFEETEPTPVFSEYQTRREMFMKSFEEFKKRIDSDPYGALFGRKLQKLCYHPRRDGWPGSSWLLKARVVEEQEKDFTKRPRRDVNINEDWDTAFWEIVPKKPEGQRTPKMGLMKGNDASKDEMVAKPVKPIPRLQFLATEEFEFDPISMRKVPKKRHDVVTPKEMQKSTLDKAIDIPVKIFKGYRAQFESSKTPSSEFVQQKNPSTNPPATWGSGHSTKTESSHGSMAFDDASPKVINLDPPTSSKPPKHWLNEEGFGSKPSHNARKSDPSPLPKYSVKSLKDQTGKVEPSVDRIQSIPTTSVKQTCRKTGYEENDSKAEDLDLLRPNDIRSSPKFNRSLKYDLEIERRRNRERLEDSFKTMHDVETQEQTKETEESIKQILTTRRAFKELAAILNSESRSHWIDPLQERFDQLGRNFLGLRQNIEILRSRFNKELQLNNGLLNEIETQKAAMRTAETQGSRKMMKDTKPSMFFQANSYANGGFAKSVLEHEKKAREIKEAEKEKERALVREIRSIYEDTYGFLDSKHRQPGATPDTIAQRVVQGEGVNSLPIIQHQSMAEQIRSTGEGHGTPASSPKQQGTELDLSKLEPVAQFTMKKSSEEENMAILMARNAKLKRFRCDLFRRLAYGDVLINETEMWISHIRSLRIELEGSRTLLDQARVQLKLAETTTPADQRLSSPPVHAPVPPVAPSLYRVLAYDSSTLKVTVAETTSSILSANESSLSPAEALSRLNNAAKFLDHFSSLQNAGYEIVSGTGDLLIFKKVREPVVAALDATSTTSHPSPWEIEIQEAQFNSSSPTTSVSPRPEKSPKTIKRTEPVFSGQTVIASSPHSQTGSSSESEPKAKTKRSKLSFVFWGALWTGGSAVAFSVVRNFFRVGTEEEREVDWLGGTRKQR